MHGYICHASGAGATIILLLACIAADAGVSDDTQHMQEMIVLDKRQHVHVGSICISIDRLSNYFT